MHQNSKPWIDANLAVPTIFSPRRPSPDTMFASPASKDGGSIVVLKCNEVLRKTKHCLTPVQLTLLRKPTKKELCQYITDVAGTEAFHNSWLKEELRCALTLSLIETKDVCVQDIVLQQLANKYRTVSPEKNMAKVTGKRKTLPMNSKHYSGQPGIKRKFLQPNMKECSG